MTEQEIAGQAIQTALVNVGISAALAWVLFKLITRPQSRSLGRRWFAWFVALDTIAVFPRVLLHQFDLNYVAQWLVVIVLLGPVVWFMGWLVGKMRSHDSG
ncbi:MAG: hypothetical protein OXF39_03480 [Nitrospira sp.]|nr:hypothetical protein [Nitrospira sp.]